MALLEPYRKQVEEQKEKAGNFYINKYNEIKDFVLNYKVPENNAELEKFSNELAVKAKLLPALF
jgi:hypothetical protein